MSSDLTRQAVKCVNEFVERADGNWDKARLLWQEEYLGLPAGAYYDAYFFAVEDAFRSLRPSASAKPPTRS